MPKKAPTPATEATTETPPARIVIVSVDFERRFARIATRPHGAPPDGPTDRHDFTGKAFDEFEKRFHDLNERAALMLG